MGDRGRRRAPRRLCLALAGLCAIGSMVTPARAQTDDEGLDIPDVFRSAATARVLSLSADRDALLPVPDLFRFIALDTTATYETDLQTARASLLFPGNGLILGPNLACGAFGARVPPQFTPLIETCRRYDYPLSVTADASTRRRSTDGSLALGSPDDPVSANAIAARAVAEPERTAAYAAIDDLRVLGLPGIGAIPLPALGGLELDESVVTIENAVSRTDQTVDGGVLTARASSVLTGVRLVGGLVRIEQIRSVSEVTDDGAGARTADANLDVQGVTVAGVPARLTQKGIVVGDRDGGPLHQQLQAALNQLLRALGIRITVLDVAKDENAGGQAVAEAGGLLVEVAADVRNLPTLPGPQGGLEPNGRYVGSIQLGNSAASGQAATFDDDVLGATDDDFGSGFDGGFDEGFGDVGAGVDLGHDGGRELGSVASPSGAGPRPSTGPGRPGAAPQLVRRLVDDFGGRLELLYAAFAFAVLGLCLTPRLIVPARLPGRRS